MRHAKSTLILLSALFAGTLALAESQSLEVKDMPDGSVSQTEGLEAWARMHDVFSHPRCVNCHVGEDNVPLGRPRTATSPGRMA